MKVSKYNFYYPLANKETLIYNTVTNALAVIEDDNFKFIKDKTNTNVEIENNDLLNNLLTGGFIIESDVKELDLLKLRILESRFDKRGLILTIAPTIDCNFNCVYCYEKDSIKKIYMSKDTQNELIRFLNNRLQGLERFSVSWYGGEPLLSMDVIEYLSESIIQICDTRNIEYSASVVTNGYNLTKDVALKLRDLRVNKVQITLDGPEDIHNQRRPLQSGNPTYETILKNIIDVSDILNLAIRINVDKDNIDQADEILDVFEEYKLQDKVFVYLGFIDDANGCYSPEKCLSASKFSQLSYDTNAKIRARNFTKTKKTYPIIVNNYCGADHIAHFVVGPTGLLYKCINDIGINDRAVGSLLADSNRYNLSLYNAYMLNMPVDDPECSECNLLPICMGGCPHSKIIGKQKKCSTYRYNLEKYLKDYAEGFIS